MKVMQFKNKKLSERLEQRQAMEDELREKIEKLEKRQATDDTTLLIVNRYWSQVSSALQNSLIDISEKMFKGKYLLHSFKGLTFLLFTLQIMVLFMCVAFVLVYWFCFFVNVVKSVIHINVIIYVI